MSVEVKFFANFREIVGQKKITIKTDSVKDLLQKIKEEYSELSSEIFSNPKNVELKEFVNVMVNGRRIGMLEGVETELEDGDTVAIFPPVAGG